MRRGPWVVLLCAALYGCGAPPAAPVCEPLPDSLVVWRDSAVGLATVELCR